MTQKSNASMVPSISLSFFYFQFLWLFFLQFFSKYFCYASYSFYVPLNCICLMNFYLCERNQNFVSFFLILILCYVFLMFSEDFLIVLSQTNISIFVL
jgi:hypothetical protein